eukprot:CAMPEP_0170066254 /NCGR_PEP_ID=MMETSP0019_2-20121128/6016_1 /TAXON_ID=98059 /ORGANISM="Dinobryon sp., Strain UTEXLB2267" /LENGTH=582 /DNA_ID=CAMNT_0010273289 /DNA_START=186 /DNA_END=1934 /DNA_ORIENTATION=+
MEFINEFLNPKSRILRGFISKAIKTIDYRHSEIPFEVSISTPHSLLRNDDLVRPLPYYDPTFDPTESLPPPIDVAPPKPNPKPKTTLPQLSHNFSLQRGDEIKLFADLAHNFGSEIVSNGRVIAIASIDLEDGKVYLFTRKIPHPHSKVDNRPEWMQSSVLRSIGSDSDGFGGAIAINDDFLAVAAPKDSSGRGCVYVFIRTDLDHFDYFHYDILAAEDNANDQAMFGLSLALRSNQNHQGDHLLLIGAVNSVYVYCFDSLRLRWSMTTKLSPSDDINSGFGSSVAVSGDTVTIGAPELQTVFVYWKQRWQEHEVYKLIAPNEKDSRFGYVMAVEGAVMAVSAIDETGSGVVYVYGREMSGLWGLQSILRPSEHILDYHCFGESLALYEHHQTSTAVTIIAVGDPGAGEVYLFSTYPYCSTMDCTNNGDGKIIVDLTVTAKVTCNDSTPLNSYGASVEMVAGNLLVGAPFAHTPHQLLAGAVYMEEDLIVTYWEAVKESKQFHEGSEKNDPSNTFHSQHEVNMIAFGIVFIFAFLVGLVVLLFNSARRTHGYISTAHSEVELQDLQKWTTNPMFLSGERPLG